MLCQTAETQLQSCNWGEFCERFCYEIKDMPSYAYLARETATGREINSTVEAVTEQAAIAALLNRNLLVVSIQEKISKRGKMKGGSVALADLVVFTRQLATMIEAGIAIVQSLQALAEQTPNKVMRDVIRDVCTRVESGESFSEALQKHPKTFNRLYYSMVSAGEKGGLLAEILARLATYLENAERLRKKVKTALMYPIGRDHRGDFHHHLPAGESRPHLQGNLLRLWRAIARTDPVHDESQRNRQKIFSLVHHRRRRGHLGLVSFHQDHTGTHILGFPPHQAAGFRPHRA